MSCFVLLGTISSPSRNHLPYAAGCLFSYANRHPDVKKNFTFLEPEWRNNCLVIEDFHRKLDQADFLGLTCYIWNQAINDSIVKVFKERKPNGIVIYGGPHVPEDPGELANYADLRPLVDHFITGPGEEKFVEFLISGERQRFYHGRQVRPEDMPAPYTDSIFDSILAKSGPIDGAIETNRGCPYACTFCDWGGQSRNKIQRFDEDAVKTNITKALEEKNITVLWMLDANFGIFKRDLDYIQFIVKEKSRLKKTFDLIFTGIAKNGSQYLSEIMDLTLENFGTSRHVKLSLQTLTESVLANLNRKNIKTKNLLSITKNLTNTVITSELIIGLPGETPSSYLKTLCQHIDLGVDTIRSHQLLILPNTPMNKKEYRQKFKIKSKRIFAPHDLNHYKQGDMLDEKYQFFNIQTQINSSERLKWEAFEVIYSCLSYGPSELIHMYDFWFWYDILYNAKVARKEIEKDSHSPEEQAYRFFDNLKSMPFFHKLVHQNREIIWMTIAKPEEETFIYTLKNSNWWNKGTGRSSELVEIYINQEVVKKELRQLYPDFNVKHFANRRKDEIKHLLSSFARITDTRTIGNESPRKEGVEKLHDVAYSF